MSDDTYSSGSERRPIGDMSVEREKGDVRICIESDDGGEGVFYLPPEQAVKVAMWLQQAAMDAKQWQRHEGSR